MSVDVVVPVRDPEDARWMDTVPSTVKKRVYPLARARYGQRASVREWLAVADELMTGRPAPPSPAAPPPIEAAPAPGAEIEAAPGAEPAPEPAPDTRLTPSMLLVWPATPPGPLRFIRRGDFRRDHYPQALCTTPTPCRWQRDCAALLVPALDEETWMVRDDAVCGRRFTMTVTPPDVRRVQVQAMAALDEAITDLTVARDKHATLAGLWA